MVGLLGTFIEQVGFDSAAYPSVDTSTSLSELNGESSVCRISSNSCSASKFPTMEVDSNAQR